MFETRDGLAIGKSTCIINEIYLDFYTSIMLYKTFNYAGRFWTFSSVPLSPILMLLMS